MVRPVLLCSALLFFSTVAERTKARDRGLVEKLKKRFGIDRIRSSNSNKNICFAALTYLTTQQKISQQYKPI